MQNPFRLTAPSVLTILLAVLMAVVYIRPISDLDFGWQVRTGERILASGRMRQPEPFSYTIAGKDVPDHEWLYETSLALLWQWFGMAGLRLVRVALFVAPILILAWQLRRRGVADDLLFLVVLFTSIFFLQFERLRPLVCSTICLQLTAGWLYDHCRGRGSVDWKLPVTFLLWGNLHPAVLMGQALLLGVLAWEWIIGKCAMRNAERGVMTERTESRRRLNGLTMWGGLALVASFVAPAPIDRLLYPFAPELRHPAQRLFIEINPPWKFLLADPWNRALTVWSAVALALLLSIVAIRRWREFRGWEWAMLLALSGLAFVAVRALGDWLLISLALVGPLVQNLRMPMFQRPPFRTQLGWASILFGVFALLTFTPISRIVPFQENEAWPRAAADWIAGKQTPGGEPWKVFARFNDGAYLIWRLNGQAIVYADTRGFYYPGEFLEDSVYLPRCEGDWKLRLERVMRQGTQYFLLPVQGADGELWRRVEPKIPQPLYRDERFVILTAQQVNEALSLEPGKTK